MLRNALNRRLAQYPVKDHAVKYLPSKDPKISCTVVVAREIDHGKFFLMIYNKYTDGKVGGNSTINCTDKEDLLNTYNQYKG